MPERDRLWLDDAGLHKRTGRKTRTLRWEAITGVSLDLTGGEPQSFEVQGDEDRMVIGWLARGTTTVSTNDTMTPSRRKS